MHIFIFFNSDSGKVKRTDFVRSTLQTGRGAFTIHVKLDDPWKGEEVATVVVPSDAAKFACTISKSVPALEGLTGKHALYLVVEGPEVKQNDQQRPQWGRRQEPQRPQGLFDLHGIGFAKDGFGGQPDFVPEITITADGKKLNIPAQPIMSTNANGYTECNHYQLYAPLKAGSKVEATCEKAPNAVEFSISPVVDGRATVKATYRGKEKIFLIN